MTPDPPGYWFDTDRRRRIESHRDRLAARQVNADNLLRDAVPFGSLPADTDNLGLSA